MIADISDTLEKRAQDLAEERMTKRVKESSGLKNLHKRIWQHNLWHEYYRQKEIRKARTEVFADYRDVKTSDNSAKVEMAAYKDETMKGIVERFVSEHEEAVHTEAGEVKEKISDGRLEEETMLKAKSLIWSYAQGQMTDRDFFEAEKRWFTDLTHNHPEQADAGKSYASNLYEIARAVKENVEMGASINALDEEYEIILGRARDNLHTEAHYSTVDRVVSKLGQNKIGRFVNETTLTSAVAIAYSVGAFASTSIARSRLLAWGTFGSTALLAGGISAARESRRLEDERRQHARDRAAGSTLESDKDKRRLLFETFRHETKSVTELTSNIERSLEAIEDNPTGANLQTAFSDLMEAESRLSLSIREKVDLVTYSSRQSIESERLQLDISRARLKASLRRLSTSGDTSFIENSDDFDAYIESLKDSRMDNLVTGAEGIIEKNRLFKKMKRREVAKAAMSGVVTGLVMGGVAQEAGSWFHEYQTGLSESLFDSSGDSESARATPLEALRRYLTGDVVYLSETGVHVVEIGGREIVLPDGVELIQQEGNLYNLSRHGEVLSAVEFTDSGEVTALGAQQLTEAGVSLSNQNDKETVIKTIIETQLIENDQEQIISAEEYLNRHADDITLIDRGTWYDNNTPAPVFDKNELRMWWGGEGNTGITESGDFAYSIEQMTETGSYHGALSADAQKLAQEGKLRLLLTMNENSQGRVFSVPIKADGTVTIDADSEIGKMFFADDNGQAKFLGRYAEIAEVVDSDDIATKVNILATDVGDGFDSAVDTVTEINTVETIKNIEEVVVEQKTIIDVPRDYHVDPPPVIPLRGRWPLEKMKAGIKPGQGKITNSPESIGYGYGYGGENLGLLDMSTPEYDNRFDERLKTNHDYDFSQVDLSVVEGYLNNHEPQYREVLNKMIENAPPMSSEIKAVVAIPAYLEEKNLEKTLKAYDRLPNKKEFEIVIFENHSAGVERDNTAEIISRLKKRMPELNIVHLHYEFAEKPPIGKVRKYLNDAILERKRMAGIDRSVIIISSDADVEGLGDNYVGNIVKAFENNPKLDAVGGKWDYPADVQKRFPLLYASNRLWQYFDIAFRYKYLKSPELIGRNAAFRSGTYAAIGGYNDKAKVAEDLEIGWMIKYIRRNNQGNVDTNRIKYINSAKVITNPRRAAVQLDARKAIVDQYGDFHENDSVRRQSLEDIIERQGDMTVEEFQDQADAVYRFYNRIKKSNDGWLDDEELIDIAFDKAMTFLRVKYHIDNDRVVIDDASNLMSDLQSKKKTL